MMNNETERTLHELKLPGMASCWSSLEETHQLDSKHSVNPVRTQS